METPKNTLELYLVRLSPACRAVWLYMLQNNLPHTLIDVDFSSGENVPEFVQKCPHNEVPVLVDVDIVVFEGPAIIRYLAMKYTNFAGFGKGLATRMLVESLLSWGNSELHKVVGPFYAYPNCLERYRLSSDEATESLTERGLSDLSKHLEHLENRYLSSQPYLTGKEVTVADHLLASVLLQTQWLGFSFQLWPAVEAWLRRLGEEEHWETVHATHRQVLSEMDQHQL